MTCQLVLSKEEPVLEVHLQEVLLLLLLLVEQILIVTRKSRGRDYTRRRDYTRNMMEPGWH